MKKLGKILKIFLTLGIIFSAIMAVAAIISKMHKKLEEVDVDDAEDDDDEACGGSCAECGMCDTEDDGELDFEMDDGDASDGESDE